MRSLFVHVEQQQQQRKDEMNMKNKNLVVASRCVSFSTCQSTPGIMQELRELNETYKLNMYKALAWTLGTFVTLFTLLSIALLTADGDGQSWQWKWGWTQIVAWEVGTNHKGEHV